MKKIILLLILLAACTQPVQEEMVYEVVIPNEVEPETYEELGVIEPEKDEIVPLKTDLPQRYGKVAKEFEWKHKKEEYLLKIPLHESIDDYYGGVSRSLEYFGELPDNYEEILYRRVLNINETEGFGEIIDFFDRQEESLSDDDFAELIISFVQSIPYDYESLEDPNRQVRFPYETLFDQTGVCSDKTLLAAKLLHHYGYGVALFVFDNELHMSLGVQCPKQQSSYLSGYCYVETTAAEQAGVAPELLGEGTKLEFQPTIYSISRGKQYSRADENVRKEVKRRAFCQQLPEAIANVESDEAGMKSLEEKYKKTGIDKDYAMYRDAYTKYRRTFDEYERIRAGCKGYEYKSYSFY